MTTETHRTQWQSDAFNMLGLFGISVALLVAFYYQLVLKELPYPLCLLQQAGLILIGLGFFLICASAPDKHIMHLP